MVSVNDVRAALNPAPRVQPQARELKETTGGDKMDSLANLVKTFDEMSPMTQQFAIARLREVNPAFRTIPLTTEELQLSNLEREKKVRDLMKAATKDKYTRVVAELTNSRGEQIPNTNMTLEQYIDHGTLDQSLFEDPERLVSASQKYASLMGDDTLALTQEELIIGGLPSAQESLQMRQAKKTSRLATQSETALERQSQIALEAEGAGPASNVVSSVTERVGEAADVNLGQGIGSDIDEDRGSEELLSAFGQSIAVGQRDFGLSPEEVTTAFLNTHGKNIADQLEELPVNDSGELVLGGDSFDVTAPAAANLAILLDQASRVTGRPIEEIMQGIGLDFKGIDRNSLASYMQTLEQQTQQESS